MNGWSPVFLGIIAAAAAVIALVHIGVLIAVGLVVARVRRLMDTLESDVRPLLGHLNAMGRDASRAVTLAAAQVERVDRLMSQLTSRVEQIASAISLGTGGSVREGRAWWRAFQAAFDAVRSLRADARARRGRGDEEDALFI